MKNVLLFFSLLCFLGCKIDPSKSEPFVDNSLIANTNSTTNKQLLYGPNLPTEPYELKLNIHQLKNNIYDLEIQMLLFNNAYYASPNTKVDLKGKFTFHLDTNNSFIVKNNLIETPLSNNTDGLTNWVRVNTTYNQQLEITTKKDFVVSGFIRFTIEPRCTLEKIPIIIKAEKGVVTFEIDKC